MNGNVAAYWPKSLFNIVLLDDILWMKPGLKNLFRNNLRLLAEQLGISEQVIWDSLRDELFLTSTLGYRFRRSGTFKADILVPDGRTFYLPFESLGGGEQTFAVMDIVLTLLRSDPRGTPWLVILDTGTFTMLDIDAKQALVDSLDSQDDPTLQTIICVNSEKEAGLLTAARLDNWIGATSFGDLTKSASM